MTEASLSPLDRAKQIAGGNTGLAVRLNEILPAAERLTPQAISQWKSVPPKRVLAISQVTGIPAHELRPDIFGTSKAEATA